MKRLMFPFLVITLLCLLLSNSAFAVKQYTLADSTPNLKVIHVGPGYISSISMLAKGPASVRFYNSDTSVACNTIIYKVETNNVSSGDTELVELNLPIGSYISFKKGLQITSNAYLGYLRINIRSTNGTGGSDTMVDNLADASTTKFYSGSGYISHIVLSSIGGVYAKIYDTNTLAAHTGIDSPIFEGGNYTTETKTLIFNPDPGSYIGFAKGVQIYNSGTLSMLRINIQKTNGNGGSKIVYSDTTAVRWCPIKESCWISDIGIIPGDDSAGSSPGLKIIIYDTNTNAVASTTSPGQPVFVGQYNSYIDDDTGCLKWIRFPLGSYLSLKYGAQITTTLKAKFIWINKKRENGGN